MSNEVDDYDDDGDGPIHINFTDVDTSVKTFHLLPAGKYIAEVTDYQKGKAGENAKNPGAQMINWEFTIESTENGETELTVRVNGEPQTIKVEGRRLFDNMVLVKDSYWRLGQFLDALWFDTSGSVRLYPDEIIEEGGRLLLEVGTQRAKKDRTTGQEYKARNKIIAFLPLESERPPDEEPPSEAKPKAKAKDAADSSEEAKV